MKVNVKLRELKEQNEQKISEMNNLKIADLKYERLELSDLIRLFDEGILDDELRTLGFSDDNIKQLKKDIELYKIIIGFKDEDNIFQSTIAMTASSLKRNIDDINDRIKSENSRISEHNKKIDEQILQIQMVNDFLDSVLNSEMIKPEDIEKISLMIKRLQLSDEDLIYMMPLLGELIIEKANESKEKQFEEFIATIKHLFGDDIDIKYTPNVNFTLDLIDIDAIEKIEDIGIYVSALLDIINDSNSDSEKNKASLMLEKIKKTFSLEYQKAQNEIINQKAQELKTVSLQLNLDVKSDNLKKMKDTLLNIKNNVVRAFYNKRKDDSSIFQQEIANIDYILSLIDDANALVNLIKEKFNDIQKMISQYVGKSYLTEHATDNLVEKVNEELQLLQEYDKEYQAYYVNVDKCYKDYMDKLNQSEKKDKLVNIKGFLLFDGVMINDDKFMPYVVSDLTVGSKLIETPTENSKVDLNKGFERLINGFFGEIIQKGTTDYLRTYPDATKYVRRRSASGRVRDGEKIDVRIIKNSSAGFERITEKLYHVFPKTKLYDELMKVFADYGAKIDEDGINLYNVYACSIVFSKDNENIFYETVSRYDKGSILGTNLQILCNSEYNIPNYDINKLSPDRRQSLDIAINYIKSMIDESFKAYDKIQEVNTGKVSSEALRCDIIEQINAKGKIKG